MMKSEFEAIAGYEISFEDYNNIIEPMYLAIPGYISKSEFVKMIDKKRFALRPISAIVKEMKKTAEHLKDTCTHYTDYEAKEKLESLVNEYIERKGLKEVATYHITDIMKFSCYFPQKVEIYSKATYKTYEEIFLF